MNKITTCKMFDQQLKRNGVETVFSHTASLDVRRKIEADDKRDEQFQLLKGVFVQNDWILCGVPWN